MIPISPHFQSQVSTQGGPGAATPLSDLQAELFQVLLKTKELQNTAEGPNNFSSSSIIQSQPVMAIWLPVHGLSTKETNPAEKPGQALARFN